MIGSLVLLAVAGWVGADPGPEIRHTWRPEREGERVTALAVTTELRGWPVGTGRDFSLSVPVTYAGVRGIAERTTGLVVTDSAGEVPLLVEDDPPDPGGFPSYRHFRAGRAVAFPLTIRYRALVPPEAQRAPPFGLYGYAGGLSGSGAGFVVLPEVRERTVSRVHWDLSGLAAGARGATSFGEGDFEVVGPADTLRDSWVMAGPLGRHPAAGGGRFTAWWLGDPGFDPAVEMAWAERMYRYLGRAYRSEAPPYRVFIRVAPAGKPGSSGGTALGASFMMGALARGAALPAGAEAVRRETIAHEMGHLFVGQIEAPIGIGSWFSEGLNTYYTRLLMMRGGFVPFTDYLADVNRSYAAYYRSPARNLSADSIVRIGFGDEEVRHMPYVRTAFYLADLDAAIRARSHGRRNLDLMVRDLFARRRRGGRFDQGTWIEAVERDAGPGAGARFEAIILRGEQTVVPAAAAFGPGLVRRELRSGGEITGYEWVPSTHGPASGPRKERR